jgi:copper homeostasis protein (lipoprotein)
MPAPASAEKADSFLIGMFVYMADTARLTDCRSGLGFPMAMEGDYRLIEQAYLEAREAPGQPLLATFDGRIEERPRMEGGGTEPTAVVHRFINVWPGETCERNLAEASLTNTYWRIVRLDGERVGVVEGRREPHLLLRADEPRFRATVGCNQIIGSYQLNGRALAFKAAASAMMACPPPLDHLERRLTSMLERTASWRINAQFLELEDGDGKAIALLQAVYIR